MMLLRTMIFRTRAVNTKTMERSGPSDEMGLGVGAVREVPRLGNLISEVEGVEVKDAARKSPDGKNSKNPKVRASAAETGGHTRAEDELVARA